MKKRTSIVLALMALVLTVVSIGLSRREVQAMAGKARSTRLFRTATKDVLTIRIFPSGGSDASATFTRKKHQWVVEAKGRNGASFKDVADAKAIEELLAILELARERPVEETGDAPMADALMLEVAARDKTPETLLIGKTSRDGIERYVARGDAPKEIHQIHADLLQVLERPLVNYRTYELFSLYKDKPKKIRLHPGDGAGQEVVMTRQPEGWFLEQPVRWPVDEERLSELLQQIHMLLAEEIVADKVGDPSVFGITPVSPRIVVGLEKEEQAVLFGEEKDNRVYAMRKGRDAVYRVSKGLSNVLALAAKDKQVLADRLRRRHLGLLKNTIPAHIFIEYRPHGTLSLKRDGETWTATGLRSFGVEPGAVMMILRVLQELTVQTFVAERKTEEILKRCGLKDQAVRISCSSPDGRRLLGLTISRPQKDGRVYAVDDDQPQVFELAGSAGHLLQAAPVFYRQRRLTEYKEEDLTKLHHQIFEVVIHNEAGRRVFHPIGRRDSGHFAQVKPEAIAIKRDAVRFVQFLMKLAMLRCDGYYEENVEDLAKFGLDQPKFRVIVTLRDPQAPRKKGPVLLDLMIGKSATEDVQNKHDKRPRVYARLAQEKTVMILDAAILKELLRGYR